MRHPRLKIEQGNPTDAATWEWLLAGQDAVLSTLGVRRNKKTTVRTDVPRNLIAGMTKQGVRKLVWLDGAGVGSSKEFMQRSSFFFGRIIIPIFLNHMYAGAAIADALIEKAAVTGSLCVRCRSLMARRRERFQSLLT